MTIEDYERLTGKRLTLLEAVTADEGGEFEFDIPKLGDFGLKIPKFD